MKVRISEVDFSKKQTVHTNELWPFATTYAEKMKTLPYVELFDMGKAITEREYEALLFPYEVGKLAGILGFDAKVYETTRNLCKLNSGSTFEMADAFCSLWSTTLFDFTLEPDYEKIFMYEDGVESSVAHVYALNGVPTVAWTGKEDVQNAHSKGYNPMFGAMAVPEKQFNMQVVLYGDDESPNTAELIYHLSKIDTTCSFSHDSSMASLVSSCILVMCNYEGEEKKALAEQVMRSYLPELHCYINLETFTGKNFATKLWKALDEYIRGQLSSQMLSIVYNRAFERVLNALSSKSREALQEGARLNEGVLNLGVSNNRAADYTSFTYESIGWLKARYESDLEKGVLNT